MTSQLIGATSAVRVALATLLVLLTTAVGAEAAVPGAPTSVAVYSTSDGELEVRWSSSDFAATTGFKVQWKSGTEEYDTSRQDLADPATSLVTASSTEAARRYKHTTTGLTNGTEYTVRVLATNTAGDSDPSPEAAGTPQSTPGQGLAFIENEVVTIHEDAFPWLRGAFDHLVTQNVPVKITNERYSFIFHGCQPRTGLQICSITEVELGRGDPRLVDATIHELGHVYSGANLVTNKPGPVGMAHVYFSKLDTDPQEGRCHPEELYADMLQILTLGEQSTIDHYWSRCVGTNESLMEAALAVVRSATSGEIPTWWTDTYDNSGGTPDLEAFWADVKATSSRFKATAVPYQLRNLFGGYCDEVNAAASVPYAIVGWAGDGPTRNPWRDSGCVPEAPGDPTAVAVGSGKLTVYWAAPAGDGGSPVEGYKVQWKSGSEEYDPSRQVEVTDLANLSYTMSDLTSDVEYTVQVLAYNTNGAGAASAEATETATAGSTTLPTVNSVAISSNPGTDQTYAAGDEIQVTVTFSKTVTVTGSPQLTLNVGGEDRTAGYERVTGSALVFSYSVDDGERDTEGVSIKSNSISLNEGMIKDSADDSDALLNHRAVAADAGHKVDGVKPNLAATGGAGVNGIVLALTFDEPLHWWLIPEAGDFTVTGGDTSRTVTDVGLSGSAVLLILDLAVEHEEEGIRVSYTPGMNPIRDVPGNEAEALSLVPVTNETPDTTAPGVSGLEITSNPGSDATYAVGDEIEATVTFNETVEVEGTPQLRLRMGSRTRPAGYRRGTNTTELVFAYEVVKGEEDTDGVSIEANSLLLNGGMIEDASNNSAVLDHDGLAADAGHKVDGAGPNLTATGGAVVNGTTLTLTFGERLDGSSTPQASAFTVTGSDTSRTVADVALSGSAVLLTVDPAVEHGETGIRVSYTVPTGPGASPLQDVLGNDVDRLSNVPITNETPDTTSPTVSKLEISSDPGTDRTYAAEDQIQVTVTFSEMVEVTGTPQLRLQLGGGRRTATYEGGSGAAALIFAYEVADGESDTGGVGVEADSLSGGTIRDEARNNAELGHDGLAADSGHKVDAVKPELTATGGAVVDGTMLTLTYDEPLDGNSTPDPGDFTVAGGDHARTVTRVSVSGSAVELTLDPGAEHEEAGIRVSYTPGMKPMRDVPGNEAEGLSRESVTNETPDTTSPKVSSLAISSNPGSDQTYAAGDAIELIVRFSETVEVEGTPQMRLRVGSRTRTAGYLRGTDTVALVFGYEVADGDEDTDGVSIEAGRIVLNGGTIEDEADNPAELTLEAVAAQAGHKVDGVQPAFVSAAVDGSSLTLTYGEALDRGSRPAFGDFTVQVDGAGRSVSGVSLSGSVVTLTLDPAVEHGETGIRVSYTVPTGAGANPLRDVVGNEAVGLSNRPVTNTTGAPNTAPEITSPSSFDVRENQSVARRLVARDIDPGDEVTGWAIVGGADQGRFSVASDTGDLSFRTAPDFEAPGDNEYEVTVEVRSGAGARELEAEQTFTLRVTDEREPPGIPEAPTFSGEAAESMTVNWSEPENTGPPITDYEVQYREGGSGGFTDAQHEGPGLSLTIDDLEPGTAYEVQVRATNDEGTSNWSESGEGMTVTPLTVEMMSGTEPPVEGAFTMRFSFSETVVGFTRTDITTQQEPACTDSANNPISCNPTIAALQTTDNRIFTTTVTPRTERVAHNYTLTITVPADTVTSAAGNKPNEEAMLEARVAPPGVTVPISSIGLTANAGNGQVTLRWNTPTNTGGAPIVRYEYRWAESGGEFGDWMRVDPSERSATVPNLTNGREYVFEVRGVNALGYGDVETARATPAPSPPRPGPGPPPPPPGPRQTVPDAPRNLLADGGDGAVTLSWDAPEDDGGSAIRDYEYRIDGKGRWISIGSTDTTHTVTGLTNGTVYTFEVRAVNRIGRSQASLPAEATPMAPVALDFAHFANGTGITSEMVLVNVSPHPIRPAIYFYDRGGHLIDPASVVDVTVDLEVTEDGGLSVRTEMEPLGELTISTHGQGELVSGSVKVLSDGPIGGLVRYGVPNIGVAGVGASPPVRDAFFPARRQAGGIRTAAALHNLGEEAMGVSCRLMSAGVALEEVEIPLEANGQASWFIDQAFTTTDTSDFLGSVRCTAPGRGRFTAIAVEMDAAQRIFSTLSVVPVDRTGGGGGETVLDFAHFVNGIWITDLVFLNLETQPSRPAPTPFHTAILPSRPAVYFYDTEGNPIAAESVVDITGDLEITEDGALTVRTEMEPLGELTISTHGRGALVSGSVRVVSEGPIGGMLRFEHPNLGVAGVGASPPVSDALFPVRRQEGGITTGVALHNLESSAGLVHCDLMREGVLLDGASIPLEANGQTAWLIDQAFPGTDTSDFAGSVRCSAPGEDLFTAVALEMDPGTRIFTTLPVVPVPERTDRE